MKNTRSLLWLALCLAPLGPARATTMIFPVEAIDDLWHLQADDFKTKYAGINITGLGPSDEGWYVRYRHENLTYMFGPLADNDAALKKKWELEAVRDAAIRNRPALNSSKVDYVKFTYSGVYGKGGGKDGSGSDQNGSGAGDAKDGSGTGKDGAGKDGTGAGNGDGTGAGDKLAAGDGTGDQAGGAGGKDGTGGKSGGKGGKDGKGGSGDGSGDDPNGIVGAGKGGLQKVASAKGGGGSGGQGGQQGQSGQQGGQSGQSGQPGGQPGQQGGSQGGGGSSGGQGQPGGGGSPSSGGSSGGGGGNPLQMVVSLLRAILGI